MVLASSTESIFRDQRDVDEFVLITAKHLAFEDQPTEEKVRLALTNNLSNGHSINIADGANVHRLIAQVRNAVSNVPRVNDEAIASVVLGVVHQFKKMAELEKEMGPNFMDRFIEGERSK